MSSGINLMQYIQQQRKLKSHLEDKDVQDIHGKISELMHTNLGARMKTTQSKERIKPRDVNNPRLIFKLKLSRPENESVLRALDNYPKMYNDLMDKDVDFIKARRMDIKGKYEADRTSLDGKSYYPIIDQYYRIVGRIPFEFGSIKSGGSSNSHGIYTEDEINWIHPNMLFVIRTPVVESTHSSSSSVTSMTSTSVPYSSSLIEHTQKHSGYIFSNQPLPPPPPLKSGESIPPPSSSSSSGPIVSGISSSPFKQKSITDMKPLNVDSSYTNPYVYPNMVHHDNTVVFYDGSPKKGTRIHSIQFKWQHKYLQSTSDENSLVSLIAIDNQTNRVVSLSKNSPEGFLLLSKAGGDFSIGVLLLKQQQSIVIAMFNNIRTSLLSSPNYAIGNWTSMGEMEDDNGVLLIKTSLKYVNYLPPGEYHINYRNTTDRSAFVMVHKDAADSNAFVIPIYVTLKMSPNQNTKFTLNKHGFLPLVTWMDGEIDNRKYVDDFKAQEADLKPSSVNADSVTEFRIERVNKMEPLSRFQIGMAGIITSVMDPSGVNIAHKGRYLEYDEEGKKLEFNEPGKNQIGADWMIKPVSIQDSDNNLVWVINMKHHVYLFASDAGIMVVPETQKDSIDSIEAKWQVWSDGDVIAFKNARDNGGFISVFDQKITESAKDNLSEAFHIIPFSNGVRQWYEGESGKLPLGNIMQSFRRHDIEDLKITSGLRKRMHFSFHYKVKGKWDIEFPQNFPIGKALISHHGKKIHMITVDFITPSNKLSELAVIGLANQFRDITLRTISKIITDNHMLDEATTVPSSSSSSSSSQIVPYSISKGGVINIPLWYVNIGKPMEHQINNIAAILNQSTESQSGRVFKIDLQEFKNTPSATAPALVHFVWRTMSTSQDFRAVGDELKQFSNPNKQLIVMVLPLSEDPDTNKLKFERPDIRTDGVGMFKLSMILWNIVTMRVSTNENLMKSANEKLERNLEMLKEMRSLAFSSVISSSLSLSSLSSSSSGVINLSLWYVLSKLSSDFMIKAISDKLRSEKIQIDGKQYNINFQEFKGRQEEAPSPLVVFSSEQSFGTRINFEVLEPWFKGFTAANKHHLIVMVSSQSMYHDTSAPFHKDGSLTITADMFGLPVDTWSMVTMRHREKKFNWKNEGNLEAVNKMRELAIFYPLSSSPSSSSSTSSSSSSTPLTDAAKRRSRKQKQSQKQQLGSSSSTTTPPPTKKPPPKNVVE